ncbi:MAG TPA: DUF1015 domain-containing protein, partial [Candidatus Omnitrophica bacterium]|nr:DUF1015 domain-containing protein [Candidatus Omnitrophota bacterium]
MTEIFPFKGILYNVSKVPIEEVLAPPYDIITPEYQEILYKRSPFNIVRIDYGKDLPGDNEKENRYTRARRYLETWLDEGIMIQSKRPAFYIYSMDYEINEQKKQIIGFLGLIGLKELGTGSILPHESTYSIPKRDRLNLLRTCSANISPIFSIYKSNEGLISSLFSKIIQTKPYIESKDDTGALHRLWQVDKDEEIAMIKRELRNKTVVIADGHHRYETALEYQREMRMQRLFSKGNEPFDNVLMFFANMLDKGLTILPAHRLIKGIPEDVDKVLSQYFEIEHINEDFDITRRMSGRKNVFGFFKNDIKKWYLLHYKHDISSEVSSNLKDIEVIVLHEVVFKKILKVT